MTEDDSAKLAKENCKGQSIHYAMIQASACTGNRCILMKELPENDAGSIALLIF